MADATSAGRSWPAETMDPDDANRCPVLRILIYLLSLNAHAVQRTEFEMASHFVTQDYFSGAS